MKGFGPQPPRSSTMPITITYKVPQCQKVVDTNLPKVLQLTLLFTGFHKDEMFWPPTSQKFHKPKTVIYRVPQCPKVVDPNLPKVPQCQTLLFAVPQRLKASPKQPKGSTMPNNVIYRVLQCQNVWAPDLPDVPQRHKLCYLQGSAMPKGCGPKPPKSSAMPNTVIYRVPQRLEALAPNNPKVPQCQGYLQGSCQKGFGPKPPKVFQLQTIQKFCNVLFTGFHNAKRFWPKTSQKFRDAKRCNLQGSGFGPKPPKSSTAIYRVPQRLKAFAPNLPKVLAIYLAFGCGHQKSRDAKHCDLQGSPEIRGFGTQPPKGSAIVPSY